MVFESENGQRILNPEKQQVMDAILKLDGVGNSYASLEDDNGNYIQVGGGPIEFTVEVRKMTAGGGFIHWKGELINLKNSSDRSIIISGSEVQVKANQILDKNMVMTLFVAFIDGEYLSEAVNWIDITKMFM